MKAIKTLQLFVAIILSGISIGLFAQTYTMPAEGGLHEGTWLQWPQPHQYGEAYMTSLDTTFIEMTKALIQSEKVHIIAYDSVQQIRITGLLNSFGIALTNVDFYQFKTNDVWARDNGPIFVRDSNENLVIEDWGFNGWGGKFAYAFDNAIPAQVAAAIPVPDINLNNIMTVEGGAYMIDGQGVLMACRSSILSQSPSNTVRNPGFTEQKADSIFTEYLGVKKFIWLNGVTGLDITDMHIDGFVQFANDSTIVTMDSLDLLYWGIPVTDVDTLFAASNFSNVPYHFVFVPLTQNNVFTSDGTDLGYQGSYCNYYIANTAVLVPFYADPNDSIALQIIQALYPGKTAIGIDVRNLYSNGGMVHCVTQQQPEAITTGFNNINKNDNTIKVSNYPNPFSNQTAISIIMPTGGNVQVYIYNLQGQLIAELLNAPLSAGRHNITFNANSLTSGIYNCMVRINDETTICRRMIIAK